MRRAIGFVMLSLAIGGVGVIVGRSIASPQRSPTREKVMQDLGLERIVPEVHFAGTPLDEAIDSVRQKTSANIVVRWRALEAAGIEARQPMTLRLTKLPLRRVLELMCEEAGGGTVVLDARAQEGAIVISSADDNARIAETKLYDVQDLVRAHYEFRERLGWRPATQPSGLFASSGASVGTGCFPSGQIANGELYVEAIEEINRMITDFVAPEMWRDAGGTVGSIREFNGRLIITATPAMHDDIDALLDKLRTGK